jgi:8-oxo-dGTP pyrophosphatase MutT (NUDIX family)
MEKTIFNKDNLQEAEVDEIVTRVKVFIMNSHNQLLLANYGGINQLPGGHVENGEDLRVAVKREVEEETGIKLTDEEIVEPFYEVRNYTRNHKGTTNNRLSKMVYYFVRTDKTPDLNNLNLTEDERNYNFFVETLNYEDFKTKLKTISETHPEQVNRIIAKETFIAFEYLDKYLMNK